MYRISASTLNWFWKCCTSEHLTIKRFVDDLADDTDVDDVALAGTAFGEILNAPEQYRVLVKGEPRKDEKCGYHYRHGIFRFPAQLIDHAYSLQPEGCLFEEKAVLKNFRGLPADIVGKCDWMAGNTIGETKTQWKYGGIDRDRYINGFQWKVYALCWNPAVVHYDVYAMSMKHVDKLGYTDVWMRGEDHFDCVPYEGIADEVENWAATLIRFLEDEGLQQYITPSNDFAKYQTSRPNEGFISRQ